MVSLAGAATPTVPFDAKWNKVAPGAGVDDVPNNRRYDQTAYLTTHNAFASGADGWLYPQQELSMSSQLAYGARGLMLDVYKDCEDVSKTVTKTEKKCKKVIRKECKKTEKKCKEKTKKVCKDLGPLKSFCKDVTETVCEGGKEVCEDVDDVVCSPVTLTETVIDHVCSPDILLCHRDCSLTRAARSGRSPQLLKDALATVRSYLEGNPAAVITIQLESHVDDAALVKKALDAAQVTSYIYNPRGNGLGQDDWIASSKGTWPYLGWMRTFNKRLVILSSSEKDVASGGKDDAGVQYIWPVTVETRFNLGEYPNCEIRGPEQVQQNVRKMGVTLFTFNHFYDASIPSPVDLRVAHNYLDVNSSSRIMKRVDRCYQDVHRLPNFVAMDFVAQGDGRKVVLELNQRDPSGWQYPFVTQ